MVFSMHDTKYCIIKCDHQVYFDLLNAKGHSTHETRAVNVKMGEPKRSVQQVCRNKLQ